MIPSDRKKPTGVSNTPAGFSYQRGVSQLRSTSSRNGWVSGNRAIFPNKSPAVTKTAGDYGADNQIRTGDLILTKDVLCHLSHISVCHLISDSFFIIAKKGRFVNPFLANFL